MKLTIAHLYYDIANLYGEAGNVTVLSHYLQDQGVEVEIKKVSLKEEFSWNDYQFVYVGAMTENNLRIVLEDLRRYSKDIQEYLAKGGYLLATGNAFELFGNYIDQISEKGLGIFSFQTKKLEKRLMSEVILENGKHDVVGFQNQISVVANVEHPWFVGVKQGMGANEEHAYEGVCENHFYGSYVVGPLLARNPYLTKWFVKELLQFYGENHEFKEILYALDEQAYESYKKIIKN